MSSLVMAAMLGGATAVTGQARDPHPPFAAESARLMLGETALHGTLLVPTGATRVPVVLIHPGSGPTDQDGNTPLLPGKNNSLRLLAEGLAARGIASLRIDKRGVGASRSAAPPEAELRFETFVSDAVGWLRQLRRDPRFGPVLVLGHSEGALIAALAAGPGGAGGYISLDGPARSAAMILRQQLRTRLAGPLADANERILSALEHGDLVDSVPPPLMVLYRPSVQPYLISWFRYVPAREVAKLSIPVLIVQGTTDLQVDTAEGTALCRAHAGAEYLQVTGMNHVLKLVDGGPAQQLASYSDSTLGVAPALIAGISAFIHAVARGAGSRGGLPPSRDPR